MVCVFNESIEVKDLVLFHYRNANRRSKIYLMSMRDKCVVFQTGNNFGCNPFCLHFIDILKYNDEFIAMKTRESVFRAHMLFEEFTELNDKKISHVMPVLVIHRFEFIKIKIEDRPSCRVVFVPSLKKKPTSAISFCMTPVSHFSKS